MKKVIKYMKVVLIKDVPNLGQVGDIKHVRPGFARNYLIAKDLAGLPGDPRAREITRTRLEKQKREAGQRKELDQQTLSLEGQKITFKVRVNKKGQPYKAIQAREIAQKLKVAENNIISKPLKILGQHQVFVQTDNTKSEITVVLKPEK